MARGTVQVHLYVVHRGYFLSYASSVPALFSTDSSELYSSQMISRRLVVLIWTSDVRKGENNVKPLNRSKTNLCLL